MDDDDPFRITYTDLLLNDFILGQSLLAHLDMFGMDGSARGPYFKSYGFSYWYRFGDGPRDLMKLAPNGIAVTGAPVTDPITLAYGEGPMPYAHRKWPS